MFLLYYDDDDYRTERAWSHDVVLDFNHKQHWNRQKRLEDQNSGPCGFWHFEIRPPIIQSRSSNIGQRPHPILTSCGPLYKKDLFLGKKMSERELMCENRTGALFGLEHSVVGLSIMFQVGKDVNSRSYRQSSSSSLCIIQPKIVYSNRDFIGLICLFWRRCIYVY